MGKLIYTIQKLISNLNLGSLVLLILTIYSCSSIGGLYSSKGNHGTFNKLRLNNDHQFLLISYLHPYKDTITGSWNFLSDTLYLKPDSMPNYVNTKTRVEEHFEKNSDSIKIRIILNDTILESSEVFVNNGQESIMTNNNGELNLSKDTEIDYFVSGSLGYPFYKHKVVNPKTNTFTVYLYDWLEEPKWSYYNFTYKYLRKNNKLYPCDNDTGKTKYYFLKKEGNGADW